MCAKQATTRVARPLMSKDFCEARIRAIGLYRAFYRYIPYALQYLDIPKNEEDCRWKLREYFYQNACIVDVRIVDLLVIKPMIHITIFSPQTQMKIEKIAMLIEGYIELQEITQQWQQKSHLMRHWNPTYEPKPCDFLGKFLAGMD